jgi:hypothetical protein
MQWSRREMDYCCLDIRVASFAFGLALLNWLQSKGFVVSGMQETFKLLDEEMWSVWSLQPLRAACRHGEALIIRG